MPNAHDHPLKQSLLTEQECLPITRALWKPYCDTAHSVVEYCNSEEAVDGDCSLSGCCCPVHSMGVVAATALWLTATPFALIIDCGLSLKEKCPDCNHYEEFSEKPESHHMKN